MRRKRKMRLRMRSITAVCMAVAMTAPMGLTGWAYTTPGTNAGNPLETTVNLETNGTATMPNKTVITGTIVATQLKVTVPTTIAFNIDPTKAALGTSGDKTANQITQPGNLKITNGSVVPIWVKVSNVSVAKAGSSTDAPDLTQTYTEVTNGTARKMMFGMKTADPGKFDTAGDWLKAGVPTSNYYMDLNSGKLEATGSATDSMTFKLYGCINKGWTVGNQFTITPTFTVSVASY